MILPLNAAQNAIHDLLDGVIDATVYDQVPQLREAKVFPFVELGQYEIRDDRTKNANRFFYTPILNVYSIQEGTQQANALMEEITRILTETTLDLGATGFCAILQLFGSATMTKIFDGELLVRHGTLRFEMQILQTD